MSIHWRVLLLAATQLAGLAVALPATLAQSSGEEAAPLKAKWVFDEEGLASLQVDASPAVMTGMGADGKALNFPVEEFRLHVGPSKIKASDSASRAAVRHTFWFPPDGLVPGEQYRDAQLVGGSAPIVIAPFVVPRRREPSPPKALLRVKLPEESRTGRQDFELQVDEGPPVRASEVRESEAHFDPTVLRPLETGSRIILRSMTEPVREWEIGTRPIERSALWPALGGAAGMALLWASTGAPARKRYRQWFGRPPGVLGEVALQPETGEPTPAHFSELSETLDRLRRTAVTTEGRLAELNPTLERLLVGSQASAGAALGATPGGLQAAGLKSPTHETPLAGGPLATLRRVIESHWRGGAGLERLESVARESSLQLYEWKDFDDVLRTMAASTVDLQFPQWTPESRGPVFLGWKESAGGAFHLAPVSPRGFATGQGLSALLKLFDLVPPPTGKVFQFRSLHRACRLSPRGRSYRLLQQGAIEIGDNGAAFELGPVPMLGAGVFEPSPGAEAVAAPADPDVLRVVVRQEIQQAIGLTLKALPRVEAALAESQSMLARLDGAVQSLARPTTVDLLTAIRQEITAVLRAKVADEALPQEAPGRPIAEEASLQPSGEGSLAEPILNLPAPDRPTSHPTAPDTAVVTGVPGRGFGWIREVLNDFQVPTRRTPADYIVALLDLKSRLKGAASCRLALGQATSETPDLVTLQSAQVKEKVVGALSLHRNDGGSILLDAVWQVFVVVAHPGEETVLSPVALVFPWSQLAKGAPVLARSLVDAGRSGPLPEFVRCVEPAILEWRGQQNAYAIDQRMLVAPIDAAPKAS